MSLLQHKIGWIGASIVALLSPATVGFVHGALDGFGLGPSVLSEILGLVIGIVLAVFIVMVASRTLDRLSTSGDA